MTLEELNVKIKADTKPIRDSLGKVKEKLKEMGKQTQDTQDKVSKSTNKMYSAFKKLAVGVVALKIGQKIGQSIVSGVQEALKVEASIQQIQRIMGESSNSFLKWADTSAIAFNMSKSQAQQYGAVFGNLLSSFIGDTGEMTNKTTELLKASSIIASSTGRSMEDVMERIRSGLLGNTEAIEDLGVNVNVAMLESTNAFRQFANGQSWEQLDFQTQSQIRLMGILEQTTKKYGDTVNQNTNTSIQQLVAHLNNARVSLGQAFLPILNVILPILTRFAQALSNVMGVFATFMEAVFGKKIAIASGGSGGVTSAIGNQANAVSGLGDAYKGTAKQAKDSANKMKSAFAGFDMINTIGSQDAGAGDTGGAGGAGGGAGAGGAGGISSGAVSVTDTAGALSSIPASIQAVADKVKSIAGAIFEPIKTAWDKYGEPLKVQIGKLKDSTVSMMQSIADLLVGIWENGGSEIVEKISGIAIDLGTLATRIYNEFISPVVSWFADTLNPETNTATQGVLDGVNLLLDGVKDLTGYLSGDGFTHVKNFLALFTAYKATGFVIQMGLKTTAIVTNTLAMVANTKAKIADNIETVYLLALYAKDAVAKGLSTIKTIALTVAQSAHTIAVQAGAIATTIFSGAMAILTSPITLIVLAIGALIAIVVLLVKNWDKVKEVGVKAWEGIKAVWAVVSQWFNDNIVKPVGNFFSNMWNGLKNGASSAWNGIKSVFSVVGTFFSNTFSNAWNAVKKIFSAGGKIFDGIKDGIASAFKTIVNTLIRGINTVVAVPFRAINSAISVIKGVSVLGLKPFKSISTISVPSIPYLAKGGVIDNATLAMVGEQGKEAVMPLENNTGWITELANKLAERGGAGGSDSSDKPLYLTLQVGSTKLGTAVIKSLREMQRQTGQSIIDII